MDPIVDPNELSRRLPCAVYAQYHSRVLYYSASPRTEYPRSWNGLMAAALASPLLATYWKLSRSLSAIDSSQFNFVSDRRNTRIMNWLELIELCYTYVSSHQKFPVKFLSQLCLLIRKLSYRHPRNIFYPFLHILVINNFLGFDCW